MSKQALLHAFSLPNRPTLIAGAPGGCQPNWSSKACEPNRLNPRTQSPISRPAPLAKKNGYSPTHGDSSESNSNGCLENLQELRYAPLHQQKPAKYGHEQDN
ncbi:unnamed protein product [Polarella glacialis]|uniref:Uncharacterized protein n=1 Tax=Polarella glacialis TaxID=89957 RepID=A0A813LHU7_POLGL|nr:unnamed protein product [Polarella glacialis]